MINYININITTPTIGIIGHGTNCDRRGIMGSGVALAVRNKWPQVYQSHKQYITRGHIMLGTTDFIEVSQDLYIVNMYTQKNFGNDGSRYADPEAILQTFETVVCKADEINLPVYIPKIGCGLGGLSFENEVKDIFEKVSLIYPKVTISVCEI